MKPFVITLDAVMGLLLLQSAAVVVAAVAAVVVVVVVVVVVAVVAVVAEVTTAVVGIHHALYFEKCHLCEINCLLHKHGNFIICTIVGTVCCD